MRPPAAKAAIHFERLTVRLEAAPFQSKIETDFFRKLLRLGLHSVAAARLLT
jgi:hypothetical protein